MPELKFYYAPGSCSIITHILLHETSLPFEAIQVPRKDRHSGWPSEYARVNPKLQVPALSIDSFTITENIAVSTAISNLAPEKHLMGKNPNDNLRVLEWCSWLAVNLHTGGFGHVFRPYRWSDEEASHEGIKMKALERVEGIIGNVEERLTGGVYAVGGDFTAVDAFLFAFYRWGVEVKFEMKEKYPRYTALVDNLVKREGANAAIKAEGLEGTW
ncbi:hypothetical protein VTL71DRAFT_1261 [Oculimacula yallundae]|uniref:Glutathione S-transferase n=1 Tax=Oculimacula yallundae TaxID=86028 RepID=A0ABR4CAZ8_9HELO